MKTAVVDLANDADPPAAITARCGIIVDKFLANDFDIWRWTDVVRRVQRDPITERETSELDAILGQFKTFPPSRSTFWL